MTRVACVRGRAMMGLVIVVAAAGGALVGGALVGCGGVPTGGESTSADGIKQYAAAALPKVEQQLPALDEGRVEIPTPDGWAFASQSKGLVTRFHVKGRTGMPQIIVKVEPSVGGIQAVTAQNVAAYADQVQAELDAQVQQKKTTLLEPARPLLLGDQPWTRYVVSGKLPGKDLATIERQILRTTQAGRTYTIDLQVRSNELGTHRDHAYAIAAGVKFLSAAAAAPPPAESGAPEAAAPEAVAPEAKP